MITVLLIALVSTVCLADLPVPPECEDKYQCFVPGDCTSWTRKESIALLDFQIHQIHDQCGALVKIQKLNEHWALLEIESMDRKVTKIELIQAETTVLSCATQPNGEVVVDTPFRKDEKITSTSRSGEKLKCTVSLKNRHKDILPGVEKRIVVWIKKNSSSFVGDFNLKSRCDPSHLKFIPDDSDKDSHMYTPVKYDSMSAYCERKGFFRTLEYQKPSNEGYSKISSLTCVQKNNRYYFAADGDVVEDGTDLVVRCVADASFFCDYDPKSRPGETALTRTKAVESTSNPSKLECPTGNQYLIVNNKSPKKGITITCQIYGGRMAYWTTSDGQILARNGPEVYCANKLPCERIRTKNVKMGQLVNSGLEPKCFEKGNLTISDDSGTFAYEEDYEFKCDETSGKLKFLGNGVATIVTEKTIFTCSYPEPEVLIPVRTKNLVIIGVSLGAGIFLAVFAFAVVPCIGMRLYQRRKKKNKRIALQKGEAEWNVVVEKSEKDEEEEEEKEEGTGSQTKSDGSSDGSTDKSASDASKKDESTKKEASGGSKEDKPDKKKEPEKSTKKKNGAKKNEKNKKNEKIKLPPADDHVTKINKAAREKVVVKDVGVLPWGAEEMAWVFTEEDWKPEEKKFKDLDEREFDDKVLDGSRAEDMTGFENFTALSDEKLEKSIETILSNYEID